MNRELSTETTEVLLGSLIFKLKFHHYSLTEDRSEHLLCAGSDTEDTNMDLKDSQHTCFQVLRATRGMQDGSQVNSVNVAEKHND